MATWLVWHLLGLYPGLLSFFFFYQNPFPEGSYSILLNPSLLYRVWDTPPKLEVPGTSELLLISPMIPKYTSTQLIPEHKHNRDRRSLRRAFRARDGPDGTAAYVQSVRVNVSLQQQHHHRDAAERLIAVPL